jgi:hypothetical protein
MRGKGALYVSVDNTLPSRPAAPPIIEPPEPLVVEEHKTPWKTRLADCRVFYFQTEKDFDQYVELFREDHEAAHLSIGLVEPEPKPTVREVPEVLETNFRYTFDQNSANEINDLQTRECNENSEIEILAPSPIETEKSPVIAFPAKPGRPRKTSVKSSAERVAALRERRKIQTEQLQEQARETLGLSVLSAVPKVVKNRGGKTGTVSRVLLENKILEQNNRCYLCSREFGSAALIDGQPTKLRAEADHFRPVAERRNDSPRNIRAACHVCNRLKSSNLFETVEHAQEVIGKAWEERGYKTCPRLLPITSKHLKITNVYN